MVRRVRKMSGGLKGKLAVALFVVALLSVAFGLLLWMFIKKNTKEKQYIAKISELEELLSQNSEPAVDTSTPEVIPVKAEKVRETELGFIFVASNISEGDYTDIRIRYIDGSDYIIASHKQITSIDREKGGIVIPVSEEELLLLNSAETDKDLFAGTKVYLTRYDPLDDNISEVNYSPSVIIKDLIEINPNINEISASFNAKEREIIEEKLSRFKGDYGDSIRGDTIEETEDYKGPVSGLPKEYGGSIWD